jgi:DivIVA domain-containing protein
MDRPSIQRSDFPTVRRGYEPDAVDAHLRHVADEVEALRSRGPVASAASSQVQKILEAAETTADQLRADAGEEAREHVHRVSTAARELLERLGAMHDELGAMMDRLREEAGRLSAELRSLERDVVELAPPVEEEEPEFEPVARSPLRSRSPWRSFRSPSPSRARPRRPPAGPARSAGARRPRRSPSLTTRRPRGSSRSTWRWPAPRATRPSNTSRSTTRSPTPGAILDDVYALAGS